MVALKHITEGLRKGSFEDLTFYIGTAFRKEIAQQTDNVLVKDVSEGGLFRWTPAAKQLAGKSSWLARGQQSPVVFSARHASIIVLLDVHVHSLKQHGKYDKRTVLTANTPAALPCLRHANDPCLQACCRAVCTIVDPEQYVESLRSQFCRMYLESGTQVPL